MVAQVTAGVIIDEPFSILLSSAGFVSVDRANRFADEPELQNTEYFLPNHLEYFSSN